MSGVKAAGRRTNCSTRHLPDMEPLYTHVSRTCPAGSLERHTRSERRPPNDDKPRHSYTRSRIQPQALQPPELSRRQNVRDPPGLEVCTGVLNISYSNS